MNSVRKGSQVATPTDTFDSRFVCNTSYSSILEDSSELQLIHSSIFIRHLIHCFAFIICRGINASFAPLEDIAAAQISSTMASLLLNLRWGTSLSSPPFVVAWSWSCDPTGSQSPAPRLLLYVPLTVRISYWVCGSRVRTGCLCRLQSGSFFQFQFLNNH